MSEEIFCEICSQGTSESPNEIVICDFCELGYHQFCHKPIIPSAILTPEFLWVCKKCFYSMSKKEKIAFGVLPDNSKIDDSIVKKNNSQSLLSDVSKTEFKEEKSNDSSSKDDFEIKEFCKTLPYDLEKLIWDDEHQANLDNIYCYCGRGVEYCRSMLQCCNCRQWFHTFCIISLKTELLIGDQYFKFFCSICNDSGEVCKRIIMKWSVAVGLALSNLTYGSDRKFFSINDDIIPFLIENESFFKLNVSLDTLSKKELYDKIETNLKLNTDKFLYGQNDNWSLNVKFPYEDPLTFSPFSSNCSSTLAKQNISFKQKEIEEETDKNNVPIGACRKGASVTPPKPNKKLLNHIKHLDSNKKNEKPKRTLNSNSETYSTEDSNDLKKKKKLIKNKKIISSNKKIKNKTIKKKEKLDDQNLLDLDMVIPYPENFEGTNNPFYCSSDSNEEMNSDDYIDRKSKISNKKMNSTKKNVNGSNQSKLTTCNNFDNSKSYENKAEYRIVNKDQNKLVLSRIGSVNENSLNNSNSKTNKDYNDQFLKKINDQDKDFKVLAQRVTMKGLIEYMLEIDENN